MAKEDLPSEFTKKLIVNQNKKASDLNNMDFIAP